ncbi:SulP family inorganic anion transporter [Lutibacter sp.]|uniref:SulP family inorganic anion transporter n=1 Tax=Lutibacter sp. TaxID=1925666 RepID=UPI0025BF7FA0|nr:SulP family inorganic anion transporter [Lutibacter sp.]MCF6181958.1 SulP family inorganic anion transporter [Lutibacter sp.]
MTLKQVFPFLTWLPMVRQTWKDDLIAGLTGTIIVIPQAVAFAMIAGMPPVYGFYTAMLTPVIAALFGSSYHLVSGPTTTSSIVLYSIISKYVNPTTDIQAFVSLAVLLSFMAGVIKLIMGIARMAKLVNFVSNSVIIGFSAGAGVLIAFKQLKHIFGIKVPQGSSFSHIIEFITFHLSEINWYVFAVAMGTLLLALIIRKIKKISKLYMLFAMMFGSFLAIWLGGSLHGIETVGSIPSNLPPFKLPDFNYENMRMLNSGAIILATLGLVEVAAISRSISLHTHQKVNLNQEFVSQGISNVVSSFFSCYTSSSSFTRSSINYQSGAKTRFSAFVSSFGLMLVMLFFAKYASFLPKAAMGGIILLVGYNLIDFKHIKVIFKSSKREVIVFSATFLGTLFLDLQQALVIGIFFSLFFYLERTSKPNIAVLGLDNTNRFINIIRDKNAKECPQLNIIRVDGSLYFGSVESIANYFSDLYENNDGKHLLVIAEGINFIDLAGAEWLMHEVKKWETTNRVIYFSGMKLVGQNVLIKGGFFDEIGREHFYKNKKIAIKSIYQKLDKKVCETCEVKAFLECQKK